MSSILKALRKVEDEKASLGEGSVDLAHDILKRNYDERKLSPWGIVTVLSMSVIIILVVVWWFWSGPQQSTVFEPKQQVFSPVPSITAPVAEAPIVKPVAAVPVPKPMPAQAKTTTVIKEVIAKKTMEPKEVKSIDIPKLIVEEIVYHQDPASRLAVINDLPVMVGTDIEGARVEEILPDQVRFSYQGIFFIKFKNR